MNQIIKDFSKKLIREDLQKFEIGILFELFCWSFLLSIYNKMPLKNQITTRNPLCQPTFLFCRKQLIS